MTPDCDSQDPAPVHAALHPCSVEAIWKALALVTDPEIPVLSIVDMGIVASIVASETEAIINLTPTFAACPAIDVIKNQVHQVVCDLGFTSVRVNLVFDPPWNTDRISEHGREKLLAFGLAPPQPKGRHGQTTVACPFCRSLETDAESWFGPTLCRSIHYCRSCQQSFEYMKPVD